MARGPFWKNKPKNLESYKLESLSKKTTEPTKEKKNYFRCFEKVVSRGEDTFQQDVLYKDNSTSACGKKEDTILIAEK